MSSPQSDLIRDADRYLETIPGDRKAKRVIVVDELGETHGIPRHFTHPAPPEPAAESAAVPELSRCAVHVTRALERLGRFATTPELRADMLTHGHEWSERTIRNALRVLRGMGAVVKDERRGGFAFASRT